MKNKTHPLYDIPEEIEEEIIGFLGTHAGRSIIKMLKNKDYTIIPRKFFQNVIGDLNNFSCLIYAIDLFLHQIEISDFKDKIGHKIILNKYYLDLMNIFKKIKRTIK